MTTNSLAKASARNFIQNLFGSSSEDKPSMFSRVAKTALGVGAIGAGIYGAQRLFKARIPKVRVPRTGSSKPKLVGYRPKVKPAISPIMSMR